MRQLLVIDNSTLFHAVFRDMFQVLLPGVQVFTSLAIEQALTVYSDTHFDLVVADLEQVNADPRIALDQLNDAFGPAQLVLMTMYKPAPDLLQALKQEGHLLIEKMSSYQVVADALVQFLGIELQSRKSRSTSFSSRVQITGNKPLTVKQVEIMKLVCDGLTGKEIARQLSLSPETVKAHLAEIYRRLGVPNRSAAVDVFLSARKYIERLEN